MNVKLLHITPIEVVILAIRQCYDSFDNSDSFYQQTHIPTLYPKYESEFVLGEKDKSLVRRIIKSGHTSTIEHCNCTFQIKGLPRFILQELARHRIASYSVKSTRYTLSELKNEKEFVTGGGETDEIYDFERAKKYVYLSGNQLLDQTTIRSLDELVDYQRNFNFSNDELKQVVPESYLCDLIMTINLRSLRNFLELRTNKRAHFEIRKLANEMYNVIPEDYKFMLSDCVYKEENNE